MRAQNSFAFAASVELREVFPDTNLHSMLISEQPVDKVCEEERRKRALRARLNFIKHRDVEQENITLRHNHFQ